jgi:Fe-Mn family superoxide dismutase
MFILPELPYAYDALEPAVSADTLQFHHDKHHRAYVEKTNALAAEAGLQGKRLEDVVRQASRTGDKTLFHNAAQAWNHGFFWTCMSPNRAAQPGRFAGLKDAFLEKGTAHFGSGWIWIILDGGELAVSDTHDAGDFLGEAARPLMTCDVWEHAYYLDHKNDREAFLEHWWNELADWGFAEAQYAAAQRGQAAWRFDAAA